MDKRPNILFLMADEHRADIAGYAGNRVIRTPNLDKIAQSGVVFENAYAACPVCIPGRQAISAGQLPSSFLDERYGNDLPPGHMTFPRRLSQYGYMTVACGKLHHTHTDMMQGWTQRIGDDAELSIDAIEDRIDIENMEGYRSLRQVKWPLVKEIKMAGIGKAPHVVKDEYSVLGALNFIDQYFLHPSYDRATPDRPLLLKVSLQQPHYPFSADADKFRYYLNRVEWFQNQQTFNHPMLNLKAVVPGIDVSEREIRRAVAAYYAMLETVDSHFGTIMKALENAGQNLDDWIIVYTSDHGEMLGEHNKWEKMVAFEGSLRIPLLIRWPKGFRGGITIDKNVSNYDIFATLCELTDIPIPPGLDSRSLAPLLRGECTEWNNEVISQFRRGNMVIKRDHLKYQSYAEHPDVLFDLQRNPEETINYIDDPDYKEQIEQFKIRVQEIGW